ncbi:MAG: MBL fold metallo-hydrolase [Chitinophagaceae bacterium]|nr:MAG: MBL fold metallo-hydrolase [Chitinophagaceae bacterium]
MLTVQTFTFNPVQENTYVLYNETGACCIIDPGCYFASEEQQLAAFVEEAGLNPVLLLNTHCHLDHIFGNRFVHQKWGLELHLHRGEVPVLERGPASGQLWQLPFVNYDGPLHFLDEGDTVRIGDDELAVLFTPGHSPGHVSFYSAAQRFILSGDVLFEGSVGRTDLPGGDFTILEESIRTKLYTLPEDVIVYSGHGGTTTIGDERRGNPFVAML